MVRRSGLGWVTTARHRPDLKGVEVGNLPRIGPNLENGIPRSMKPAPPRTTEPDTHGRGTRTDHSARITAVPETRTSRANGTTTALGPGTRTTAADGNGATSSQSNPAVLEDPESQSRSEMSSRRRRQPPPGNRARWWSEVDEPAYPMCYMGLARGRCAPPSIPRLPAPLTGSRPSGGRPRHALPEMHR